MEQPGRLRKALHFDAAAGSHRLTTHPTEPRGQRHGKIQGVSSAQRHVADAQMLAMMLWSRIVASPREVMPTGWKTEHDHEQPKNVDYWRPDGRIAGLPDCRSNASSASCATLTQTDRPVNRDSPQICILFDECVLRAYRILLCIIASPPQTGDAAPSESISAEHPIWLTGGSSMHEQGLPAGAGRSPRRYPALPCSAFP